MFKSVLLIIALAFFVSCAGSQPSKEPVVNTMETESGDTIWSSGYTPGSVKISKDYKWVGSQDRSDQKSTRKAYIWAKDGGSFIYIIDWKSRKQWSFPKDNDGLLGRKNDPNDPYLLAYKPNQYSIWKGMQSKTRETIKQLGVDIPKCIAAFERGKMSPSRSSAFWIVYVEKTDCGYKGWGGIGTRADSTFTIN